MAASIRVAITLLLLTLLAACAAPRTQVPEVEGAAAEAEARKQRALVLDAFLESQLRLERVGAPILVAALPYCEEKRRHTVGAWFWNRETFPQALREAAVERFGAGDAVQVGFVRDGSPAADAGLAPGDVPVQVDTWSVPSASGAMESFDEHVKGLLVRPHPTPIRFLVRRGSEMHTFVVTPAPVCDYDLVVERSDDKNAYADGERVVVFQGMMDFLDTDEELATVVAHEVAHNAMGHIASKQTNAVVGGLFGLVLDVAAAAAGVNTQGEFTKLGAQAGAGSYSVEFEQEADYVGLYLMANAGYDERKAPNLWRRMAIQNPKAIAHRSSHPTTPERFLALEEAVSQIGFKRQTGAALAPDLEPAGTTTFTTSDVPEECRGLPRGQSGCE